MVRMLILLAAAACLAGCAKPPEISPPAANDPANPHAPEAPVGSIVQTLALAPRPASAADASAPGPGADGMQHMDMQHMDMQKTDTKAMDMQPMRGMDKGMDMKGMDMKGMDMSGRSAATQPATQQALYTCKMHPQVVSDHPGQCPICGMKLAPKGGGK